MAFTRPAYLLLLFTIPYFVYLGWPAGGRLGSSRAWLALAIRCAIVMLVVLSLAGVQAIYGSGRLAVVFLVDVSDSVPRTERERAMAFVGEALEALAPDDRAALVLFGADAFVERPMRAGGELGPPASIPRTHQTNLEQAIRLGMALFPSGAARRLVILSDGRPTLGDAETIVRLARAQGIRVDVVPLRSPLEVDGETEAWLTDLSTPTSLHQGEEFTISITARATRAVRAMLTVLAGERVVANEAWHLNPGDNTFLVPVVAGEPGFMSFRAVLSPAADVYHQNNALSAFTFIRGAPRILLVSSPHQGEDEGAQLAAALRAAGLAVERSTPGSMPSDPAGLADYAAVILVDTPARFFSPRALGALQSYVRDLGGGLLAVGGPRSYGVGGWYNTPLEEALPVAMTIVDPQRFPPMSLVVVIDTSGSMAIEEDGVQKIRLAGEAAARVAELIHDADEITVIAFDTTPADIIGPLPGSRRAEVMSKVIRLQAGGGGIYVRESLQTALEYLSDSAHRVRHLILLADGADAEHQEGVRELVREHIAAQKITLSVVAIGEGPDLRFLEEIAILGNGRYHFTDRAANLPVIFAEETQLAMRSYVVEEPFFPVQTSSSSILTGIEAVPLLLGYVATSPKAAGQVVLSTPQGDPLLAAWQYGLGRAVAWTSDASGRWARRWVEWDGFPRFWGQAVRWTITGRSDMPVEMDVTLEGDTAHITVDATDEHGNFLNGLHPVVSVVGPGGEHVQVRLIQCAPCLLYTS
ncbi:MAG: VWA domain-containing protein, partial [Anaerolineae bacterium]|nr:VWA domain-containing protein [Anaerolineae bacterium]